jgi:acetyltransferase-like isoleucine patch superfamily enzyme
VSHKGIKIGNNCWIGAGAVFLDGAVVGNGCVVGANAVVTKKFPDNSIIIGIPAKLYKRR